jgi:hypothetical protein
VTERLNKRGSFGHPCRRVWPARARSPPGEASEEPADPMRPPPAVPRQRTAWARAHARASPSGAGRSTLDVARADTSDGGGPDGSAVDQARAEARPRTTPGLGSAHTPGPSSHASPATGDGRSRMTTVQWGGTLRRQDLGHRLRTLQHLINHNWPSARPPGSSPCWSGPPPRPARRASA